MSEGPAPEPRWRGLAAFWTRVGTGWSRAATGLVAQRRTLFAIIAAFLILIFVWNPFIPREIWWRVHPPDRSIFVDSPEVYSRERLINERLSEETWLNAELDTASETQQLSSIRARHESDAGIVAPLQPAGDPPAPAEGSDAPPASSEAGTGNAAAAGIPLTFDQEFKLRSAYRSLIRQRLIENKLDDRHDLEGNSLYILKFDTTVINVPATGDRALVKIRILPPEEIESISADSTNAAGDSDGGATLAGIADPRRYAFLRSTYLDWIASIQSRVNDRISHLYDDFLADDRSGYLQEQLVDYLVGRLKGTQPALVTELQQQADGAAQRDVILKDYAVPAFARALQTFFALRAAAEVTGGNLRDLSIEKGYESGSIAPIANLPFSNYFYPVIRFSESVQFPPSVDFSQTVFYGTLIDGACAEVLKDHPDASLQRAVFRGNMSLGGKTYAAYYYPNYTSFDDYAANDRLFKQAVEYAFDTFTKEDRSEGNGWRLTNGKTVAGAAESGGFRNCAEDYDFSVTSGLLSFTTKISRFTTYSYSVLPRESPIAVMNEILQTRSAVGSVRGFSVKRLDRSAVEGVELRPTLTTFGDIDLRDATSNNRQPIVGWIVDPSATRLGTAEDYQPGAVSASVLAIISVPAWWSAIHLEVEKAWWGETRVSAADEREPPAGGTGMDGLGSMDVRLPNRYELLDGLLIDDLRRSPVITGIDVSSDQACGPFRVLIVGERLWRNTAVTIGSHKAVKIEVLPNMEGILAEFASGERPPIATSGPNALRVWTSEGVAELPRELASGLAPTAAAACDSRAAN